MYLTALAFSTGNNVTIVCAPKASRRQNFYSAQLFTCIAHVYLRHRQRPIRCVFRSHPKNGKSGREIPRVQIYNHHSVIHILTSFLVYKVRSVLSRVRSWPHLLVWRSVNLSIASRCYEANILYGISWDCGLTITAIYVYHDLRKQQT